MQNNTTPTFAQQYDKIVGAYLRNELSPFDGCACFVGNLLNNNDGWESFRTHQRGSYYGSPNVTILPDTSDPNAGDALAVMRQEAGELYTVQDICDLEQKFLRKYNAGQNEESLFEAMQSTLLLLRMIHEAKGEIVQDYLFVKRPQPVQCPNI